MKTVGGFGGVTWSINLFVSHAFQVIDTGLTDSFSNLDGFGDDEDG
jgi:hypothetical protein